MDSIRLRGKLVAVLGFESQDGMQRYRIINDFVRLAVEKTLEDVLDQMAPEELGELQAHIARNADDLVEMCKKHNAKLEIFFAVFNRNLDGFIEKFQKKKEGNESAQNILLDMKEENESYFADKGVNFQKVVGRDVLGFAIASILTIYLSGGEVAANLQDNPVIGGADASGQKNSMFFVPYGKDLENIVAIPDFLTVRIAEIKDNPLEFIVLQLLDMVVSATE